MSSNKIVLGLLLLLTVTAMAQAAQTAITFDTNSSTFLAGASGSTQYNWNDLTFTPQASTTISAATLTAGNGSAAISSLGVFKLPDCLFCGDSYNTGKNDGFDLKIHFTAPVGIVGGQTAGWDADLTGYFGCIGVCSGTVGLYFDTWTQTFNYGPPGNQAGSGSFTLSLDGGTLTADRHYYEYDLSGCTGDTQTLTGKITNASFTPHDASVPEPTSVVLLGTVLSGVAVLLRRKRLA